MSESCSEESGLKRARAETRVRRRVRPAMEALMRS